MRKIFFFILFAALSLTIVAQEKKTITIQQPKCDNAAIAKIMDVTSAITLATANEQSQLQPKNVQNVCKSLAKQLLDNN